MDNVDSAKDQIDQLCQICSDAASYQTQPADPGDECVIDWNIISKTCEHDEDVISKLGQVFLESGQENIDFLAKAIKADNPKDIRLCSHRLRGAALNIGAVKLAEKTNRIECAAEEKDIQTARALFGDAKAEIEKVLSFLYQPDWLQTAKRHHTTTISG